MTEIKPPYPFFGGKSTIAAEVWQRFGNVQNYVEPFFGSGAVLLARPDTHGWWDKTETVNDMDGLISNFWRAVQADPDQVAHYADWPINENDLTARHLWLVGQKDSLQAKLEGDPEYYDAKIAGWWVWGMACWIGSGFCSGNGPWQSVNGELVNAGKPGVNRKLVHLGDDGRGVNRQLVHLGDDGRGVNRQRVHLGDDGQGVNRKKMDSLIAYMNQLQDRLRRVRVCCGDWKRICRPMPLGLNRYTDIGVFLDPPYAQEQGRDMGCYRIDSGSVAWEVRDWAIEMGKDKRLKIALCGYEGIEMPADWECFAWKAGGGYSNQGEGNNNRFRERSWFSPACQKVGKQMEITWC